MAQFEELQSALTVEQIVEVSKAADAWRPVRIGSIFEDSKIPMKTWLLIISQMCSAKKGVSASQIQRMTDLSYRPE